MFRSLLLVRFIREVVPEKISIFPGDELSGLRQGKVVALVEWNSAGHHQTYFQHFSAALLAEGARVVPLCPWDAAETTEQVRLSLANKDRDLIANFERPRACRWQAATAGRGARWRHALAHWRHFYRISRELRNWERRNQSKIDLIFFSCIYDHQFAKFPMAARLLRRPWSGLYFDSRFVRAPGSLRPYSQTPPRPDKIFSARGLHSLAILDEGIVEQMQAMTSGKPVVCFPDFADCRVPDGDRNIASLGKKIRTFAGGRKIVGCLGHLQKTKGLLELVRAAKDPRLSEVFFAFVGEVNLYGIEDEHQEEIKDAWENQENTFCHPLRVSTELIYNSAFRVCDIIAAVYSDFPNSSNTLTKAAAFSKPVVVSSGHLLEERVRKFHLGLVVPERSSSDLATAIISLVRGDSAWNQEEARWKAFLDQQSPERLRIAFASLIGADTRDRRGASLAGED